MTSGLARGLLLACALLPFACKRAAPEPPREQAAVSIAEKPAAPTPRPWYEGDFSAQLELQPAAPSEGAGLPRAWSQDPGGAVGPARLSLSIDSARNVRGELTGAVTLQVRGTLDGDSLRAELEPELEPPSEEPAASAASTEAKRFHGTLVAARPANVAPESSAPGKPTSGPPTKLVGTLRLSSGDSLLVRRAAVSLERAPQPAPPHQ